MTEQDTKKVLSLGGRPKLELKKPVAADPPAAAGSVKQSFSHGRSKTVAVEVKARKRVTESDAPKPAAAPSKAEAPAVTSNTSARSATTAQLRQLTEEERNARARALRGAAVDNERREIEEAQQREAAAALAAANPPPAAEANVPLTRDALRQRELEELRAIQAQEKAEGEKKRVEDDLRSRNLQAMRRSNETSERSGRVGETTSNLRSAVLPGVTRRVNEEEDEGRGGVKKGTRAPTRPRPADDDRRIGRLTVSQALSDDDEGGRRRGRSMASIRRRMERERREAMGQQEQVKVTRDVIIPEAITVGELANRMAERGADVIKALMKMGVMATITQTIDPDTAELVATEFGHRIKRVTEADVEADVSGISDDSANLLPRPPVVTVMGHVDHGKTSLLDALRKANVVAGEAGGITQHIGAYQVVLPEPVHGFDRVTFIDTPGHAAFTEMRSRGAQVTDIVILVVAADDGIMPQTIEAIRHAKAANVPMIVAINKCDLPAANPTRVRTELLQHDIQVEELGGETLSVEISAKTKMGIDKLLETILLQAEILDLKANPDRPAEGSVIEAKLERGRGSVATVLIRRGTLKVGDIFVAGAEFGKVRALIDDHGKNVVKAGPAMPVEVLGLNGSPSAGDEMLVVADEAKAREIAEFRARRKRSLAAAASARGSLEQQLENIKAGSAKEFAVLIKGDVHGSVEAIKNALVKLTGENTEVRVRVLDAAVGAVTESDITLAKASHALIIGFNVRANAQAREMAKRDSVEIRYYSIIYNVIDDVKLVLEGMLAPTLREKFLGNAQILQVFNITKVGKIAGCKVTEGIVKRGSKVRLLRDNVVIHEGTLKTLKRVKDEVKEVREGFECGMAFENYDNLAAGDVIECFDVEEIARSL